MAELKSDDENNQDLQVDPVYLCSCYTMERFISS